MALRQLGDGSASAPRRGPPRRCVTTGNGRRDAASLGRAVAGAGEAWQGARRAPVPRSGQPLRHPSGARTEGAPRQLSGDRVTPPRGMHAHTPSRRRQLAPHSNDRHAPRAGSRAEGARRLLGFPRTRVCCWTVGPQAVRLRCGDVAGAGPPPPHWRRRPNHPSARVQRVGWHWWTTPGLRCPRTPGCGRRSIGRQEEPPGKRAEATAPPLPPFTSVTPSPGQAAELSITPELVVCMHGVLASKRACVSAVPAAGISRNRARGVATCPCLMEGRPALKALGR